MRRLIAIADIHGQFDMLSRLLDSVQPESSDQCVFLGDYVDRGAQSKAVIERLIAFGDEFPQTVFLRGNHDQMLLDSLGECGVHSGPRLRDLSTFFAARAGSSDRNVHLMNGGQKTLDSYNWPQNDFPVRHLAFLQATELWWRYEHFTFVHAGLRAGLLPELHDPYVPLWERFLPPGADGQIHVVGHQVVGGLPRFESGRYWLDTGAGQGNRLTACDVLTCRYWQAG